MFKISVILLFVVLIYSCGSKLPDSYHMEKRYWDVSDYNEAVEYIKSLPINEGRPRINDPLTAPVFIKLVDAQNVSIILNDSSLGIKHRNEIAVQFFNISLDIIESYKFLDKQDKYIYPLELVKAIEFGLNTQLLYFKVGNQEIIKNAINPEASDVKNILVGNEQTIANNFNNDILFLTKEDALNNAAITEYSEMINICFAKLIKEFPQANYSEMRSSAQTLTQKVKSAELKKALANLVDLIDNNNKKE